MERIPFKVPILIRRETDPEYRAIELTEDQVRAFREMQHVTGLSWDEQWKRLIYKSLEPELEKIAREREQGHE